jgi:hypothetical protein
MQAEVFEALRAIDIPEDKALKAAAALSRRDEDVAALRSDVGLLKNDTTTLKGDATVLKADVTTLKRDMAVLRWMVGTLYPLVLAVLVKLFVGGHG